MSASFLPIFFACYFSEEGIEEEMARQGEIRAVNSGIELVRKSLENILIVAAGVFTISFTSWRERNAAKKRSFLQWIFAYP